MVRTVRYLTVLLVAILAFGAVVQPAHAQNQVHVVRRGDRAVEESTRDGRLARLEKAHLSLTALHFVRGGVVVAAVAVAAACGSPSRRRGRSRLSRWCVRTRDASSTPCGTG